MSEKDKDQIDSHVSENPSIVDINKVIDGIKDPKQRSIIAHAFSAMVERKTFSGPLPAPEDFKAYQNVMADAPDVSLRWQKSRWLTVSNVKRRSLTHESGRAELAKLWLSLLQYSV